MRVVFIHGPAACGKLTVATELAARTGMKLFHNHLTVDLVGSLFEFGSEPFVALRESIWLLSFETAARCNESLIFTFHPEASVSGDFPQRAVATVRDRGGDIVFFELGCPESEIERRVESKSRSRYGKLNSLDQYRRLRDAGAFEYPALPEPALRLDTAALSPAESAARIHERLRELG